MNYMIQHYLKTAIRNLLKYKTHSIISAICLSVGMTCFSIIHFFINEIDGASRNMPNFEQRISIRMINSNHEVGGWGWSLNSSEIQTLTEHPIPGIKQICFHSYQREAEVVFINRSRKKSLTSFHIWILILISFHIIMHPSYMAMLFPQLRKKLCCLKVVPVKYTERATR